MEKASTLLIKNYSQEFNGKLDNCFLNDFSFVVENSSFSIFFTRVFVKYEITECKTTECLYGKNLRQRGISTCQSSVKVESDNLYGFQKFLRQRQTKCTKRAMSWYLL